MTVQDFLDSPNVLWVCIGTALTILISTIVSKSIGLRAPLIARGFVWFIVSAALGIGLFSLPKDWLEQVRTTAPQYTLTTPDPAIIRVTECPPFSPDRTNMCILTDQPVLLGIDRQTGEAEFFLCGFPPPERAQDVKSAKRGPNVWAFWSISGPIPFEYRLIRPNQKCEKPFL